VAFVCSPGQSTTELFEDTATHESEETSEKEPDYWNGPLLTLRDDAGQRQHVILHYCSTIFLSRLAFFESSRPAPQAVSRGNDVSENVH